MATEFVEVASDSLSTGVSTGTTPNNDFLNSVFCFLITPVFFKKDIKYCFKKVL